MTENEKIPPTLAELDAAVEEARMQVMAWGPEPDISTRYGVMADDVSALIAAAEARGAAKERATINRMEAGR
jgi:hypothetical protein